MDEVRQIFKANLGFRFGTVSLYLEPMLEHLGFTDNPVKRAELKDNCTAVLFKVSYKAKSNGQSYVSQCETYVDALAAVVEPLIPPIPSETEIP